MRLVVVFPLLVQSCGALVVPASALRRYSRPRKCIEPPQLERLPFGHGAAGRANRFTASMVDGGDPPTQGSSTDDEDGGINVVKARLSKPVGLLLAEKETGLPGLVVDGIAEGGSAKECGIVLPGMALVSAGGVDCGELVFDQVVELLQSYPAEEPIDFVFSSADVGPP